MELESYKAKIAEITKEFEEKKLAIATAYAISNSPYTTGDIFTDHIGSIRIERSKVDLYAGPPCLVFYGLELKKDGTPTKKESKRWAYQTNDIKAPTQP